LLAAVNLALSVLLKATALAGRLGPLLQWLPLLVAAALCVWLLARRRQAKVADVRIPAYSKKQRILGLAALLLVSLVTFGPRIYRRVQAAVPPNKIIVLVAEFDGPDRQKYQFRQRFTNKLHSALSRYSKDVEVRKLDTIISEGTQQRDIAAIGSASKATILIWGWYAATTLNAQASIHFELLRPPKVAPLLSRELQGEVRTCGAAELNSFALQEDLSGELAFACLFTVGLARYSANDRVGAIDALSEALVKGRAATPLDKALLLFYRGGLFATEGDTARAIVDYSEGADLRPDFAEILFNRGNLYTGLHEYEKATADYTGVIGLRPDYADAFLGRGYAHFANGDTVKAITDLTEAIKLRPDFAEAYSNRGGIYRAKGDFAEAIADHTEAVRLRPDDATFFFNRGNAYSSKGDHDRSIADYSEAIRLMPSYASAWCNRGNEYYVIRDFDKAIADADEAIRLQPDMVNALYNRGLAHNARREYHQAIADLTVAIKLKPDDADAFLHRSRAYDAIGDSISAGTDLREVVRLRPDVAKMLDNNDSVVLQIIVPRSR